MRPQLALDVRKDVYGRSLLHFPAMFLSDPHLFSKHTNDQTLAHALERTAATKLYGVGDIVDGDAIRKQKKARPQPWHRQNIAHFLRKKAEGTELFYIPGNHDVAIRQQKIVSEGVLKYHRNLCGKALMGIRVEAEIDFVDCVGYRYKIIHGDLADPTLGSLTRLGDAALDLLADIDRAFKTLPYCGDISVAACAKHLFKKAIDKLWKIRENLANDINADGFYHGILTGHSHRPEVSRLASGKLLLNSGSCTDQVYFLVQDRFGTWGLIEWHRTYIKIYEESDLGNKRSAKPRVVKFVDLGLTDVCAPPRLIEDEHAQAADRLIRLAYLLYSPHSKRASPKRSTTSAPDRTAYHPHPMPLGIPASQVA